MSYGQQPDSEALDARRKEAWFKYSAMQCAPGWQEASKQAAAEAARAMYALDKANGYIQQ